MLVDGRDVSTMSPKEGDEYRLRHLGIIGQPHNLIPGARAIENASLKLWLSNKRGARDAIEPLLERLGLGERMQHRTEQLSMGERQRVLIAMALATDPKLVLADEPTGTLDTQRTREVLGLLSELCRERGAAIVLATHDPLAAAFADQVHELRDGRLGEYVPDHGAPRPRPIRAPHRESWCEMARMSLSDILWLYRARLRARAVLVQECFAILGIAIGVALLFASQVASTSLTRSVSQLTSQLVGNTQFQLDARGPGGFDERLLGAVRRVPGVQAALPVLEQQANVIGPTGAQRSVDLIGTDPRFAHFAGTLLRRFSAKQLASQQAIALPAPLADEIGAGPLETIKLQIGASVVQTLLGATLGEADIGGLVHSPVALAPVGYAQRLSGMGGRITRIFVQSAPGREREVRAGLQRLAATAPVNVEPSNYDSTLFGVAVAPESQSEALFSAISALVGFMFALNAMLVTVPSRRKLIADIRPQGATRLMTVQILLFDAAVLGVLACLLGLALGELLSIAVFHATPGYLSFAFPVGNERIVTWQSVALAVGAGLAAAVVGVLWPLRDIVARPLRETSPRRSTAAGGPRLGWRSGSCASPSRP